LFLALVFPANSRYRSSIALRGRPLATQSLLLVLPKNGPKNRMLNGPKSRLLKRLTELQNNRRLTPGLKELQNNRRLTPGLKELQNNRRLKRCQQKNRWLEQMFRSRLMRQRLTPRQLMYRRWRHKVPVLTPIGLTELQNNRRLTELQNNRRLTPGLKELQNNRRLKRCQQKNRWLEQMFWSRLMRQRLTPRQLMYRRWRHKVPVLTPIAQEAGEELEGVTCSW